MDAMWYDSLPGIAEAIKTYAGLERLVGERFAAGYQRGERMQEFCVLRTWVLDTCGNLCKLDAESRRAFSHAMPAVVELGQLSSYHAAGPEKARYSYVIGMSLAPERLPCADCGEKFTLATCTDVTIARDTAAVPLAEFIGRPLGDVKKAYAERGDASYFMQEDLLVRNDRFIDLTRHPKYDFVLNERGWKGKRDGIGDDYVIQDGDDGFFNVWRYMHDACATRCLEAAERERIAKAFADAGIAPIFMNAIPNQYCPCASCPSWQLVETSRGTIVVGPRKRVYNVDWSDTDIDAAGLFANEEVTKSESYIHAWTQEKLVEYLALLIKAPKKAA